jgi:hypothetical protein
VNHVIHLMRGNPAVRFGRVLLEDRFDRRRIPLVS